MAQDNNAICILRPPPFGASRSNQRAHQSHRRCMTHTLWMLALLLRIQACMLRRADPIMRLCPQWIDRLIDIRRSSSWLLPWIRTYSFSQVVGKTVVCGQIGHKAPSITKAPTLVGFHNQATFHERGRAASLGDADRRTCPPNTAA